MWAGFDRGSRTNCSMGWFTWCVNRSRCRAEFEESLVIESAMLCSDFIRHTLVISRRLNSSRAAAMSIINLLSVVYFAQTSMSKSGRLSVSTSVAPPNSLWEGIANKGNETVRP
jgi:hypothetical protein